MDEEEDRVNFTPYGRSAPQSSASYLPKKWICVLVGGILFLIIITLANTIIGDQDLGTRHFKFIDPSSSTPLEIAAVKFSPTWLSTASDCTQLTSLGPTVVNARPSIYPLLDCIQLRESLGTRELRKSASLCTPVSVVYPDSICPFKRTVSAVIASNRIMLSGVIISFVAFGILMVGEFGHLPERSHRMCIIIALSLFVISVCLTLTSTVLIKFISRWIFKALTEFGDRLEIKIRYGPEFSVTDEANIQLGFLYPILLLIPLSLMWLGAKSDDNRSRE